MINYFAIGLQHNPCEVLSMLDKSGVAKLEGSRCVRWRLFPGWHLKRLEFA